MQLTIDVGGEKIEKRWCDPSFPTTGASTCKDYPLITPNISLPFRWDGKDAYDRTVQGRVTATIKVIYVYEFNYYGVDNDGWASSFSQFGSDTQVFDGRYACGNRSGTMDTHFFCGVPVGQTITRAIGSWDARPTDGLGGWSLYDHHAYDPVERALHRGDGATIRAEALPPVVQKLAGTTNTGVGSRPRRRELPEGRRSSRPRPTSTTWATTSARPTATSTSTTASTATTSSASAATARSTCSPATAPRAAR